MLTKPTIRIVCRVLWGGAALCAVAFAVAISGDWAVARTHPEWSAPFSTHVLLRGVEFIVPGVLCVIAARSARVYMERTA
jgi:hypothetical protein